jgi:hypothetical protein
MAVWQNMLDQKGAYKCSQSKMSVWCAVMQKIGERTDYAAYSTMPYLYKFTAFCISKNILFENYAES